MWGGDTNHHQQMPSKVVWSPVSAGLCHGLAPRPMHRMSASCKVRAGSQATRPLKPDSVRVGYGGNGSIGINLQIAIAVHSPFDLWSCLVLCSSILARLSPFFVKPSTIHAIRHRYAFYPPFQMVSLLCCLVSLPTHWPHFPVALCMAPS